MIAHALMLSVVVHPLSGTVAQLVWLLPLFPLLGFVVNGILSLNSAKLGPAEPSMPRLDEHSEGTASSRAEENAEHAGAHGDDHHLA